MVSDLLPSHMGHTPAIDPGTILDVLILEIKESLKQR
jgi:hypothetical protein